MNQEPSLLMCCHLCGFKLTISNSYCVIVWSDIYTDMSNFGEVYLAHRCSRFTIISPIYVCGSLGHLVEVLDFMSYCLIAKYFFII